MSPNGESFSLIVSAWAVSGNQDQTCKPCGYLVISATPQLRPHRFCGSAQGLFQVHGDRHADICAKHRNQRIELCCWSHQSECIRRSIGIRFTGWSRLEILNYCVQGTELLKLEVWLLRNQRDSTTAYVRRMRPSMLC
jgi:hypothetical protein